MKLRHDTFLRDAASILSTAEAPDGQTDYTLLIGQDGGLQMVADSDWPLDTLAAHHGAERAYRVRRGGGQVRVEGQSGTWNCTLASKPPAAVARGLLGAPGLYQLG